MLIRRQTSKQKQKILIVIVILMNVMAGYLVYHNFFSKARPSASGEPALVELTLPQIDESVAVIETITQAFDRSLLDREEFRALQKYGSGVVEGAVTGRVNPFLPAFGP